MGFDLPLWLQRDSSALAAGLHHAAFQTFVPPKILITVLDSWFDHCNFDAVDAADPPPQPSMVADGFFHSDPSYTWLASLNRRLPHSWVDSTIVSTSAVQADAANIPTHLWDHRISLVFPCPSSHLSTFRKFALRVWRRNLLRSFCRFLRVQYGSDWCNCMLSSRRLVGLPSPTKRIKGGMGKDIGASSRCPSLLQDVEKGGVVLSQAMDASWWEWSEGSSLFFWQWLTTEQQCNAPEGMPLVE